MASESSRQVIGEVISKSTYFHPPRLCIFPQHRYIVIHLRAQHNKRETNNNDCCNRSRSTSLSGSGSLTTNNDLEHALLSVFTEQQVKARFGERCPPAPKTIQRETCFLKCREKWQEGFPSQLREYGRLLLGRAPGRIFVPLVCISFSSSMGKNSRVDPSFSHRFSVMSTIYSCYSENLDGAEMLKEAGPQNVIAP